MTSRSARHVVALGIVVTLMFFGTAPLVQAGQEAIGDFFYVPNTDDFDDSDRSSLLSESEGSDDAILGWSCMFDGLNVVLNVGTYYAGDDDDDILVRYRFDRNEPKGPEYWTLFSGQNEIAYLPADKLADFTSEAIAAVTIVVEATDPSDSENNRFRFGLEGLDEGLARLPCADR